MYFTYFPFFVSYTWSTSWKMKNLDTNKAVNVRFSKSSEKNFCMTEKRTKLSSNGNNKNGFEANLTEG